MTMKVDFPDAVEFMRIVHGSKYEFRVLDEPVERERRIFKGKSSQCFCF
jgi:hypothetical protein